MNSATPPPRATLIGAFARLMPTVRHYSGRVTVALCFLVTAKLANIGVPLVLKHLVDGLDVKPSPLVIPLLLLMAYGALRLSTSLFQELRTVVFARVLARTSREITLRVFAHLHSLSLRFHLDRRTGGVARDVERGMTSVSDLLDWTIYTILPTLFEITLICGILIVRYDWGFALITLATLVVYITFTFSMTEWRLRFYRAANEADTEANARNVDALLNYETVKYFNNERHELNRFDGSLRNLEEATVRSQKSLAALNVGQTAIVAVGLTLLLWRASAGVVAGRMTLGDLVLVNAFLIQLSIPLNYLGMVYREVKQALTNIERMFVLLDEPQEIRDAPGAKPLAAGGGEVRFENVSFGYDPARGILYNVDFSIPAGKTVAVVGTTGAGKSTLSRLLYRFYDVSGGRILIDGQDIRERDPGFAAHGDRHRAAGHGAVQRLDLLQHRLWQTRRHARGSRRRRARGAYPRLHREPAAGLRHRRRRARPETLRRRETARRDRAHPAQESGNSRVRRSHQRARHAHRKNHPGRTRRDRARAHHADHRASPVDDRRCR